LPLFVEGRQSIILDGLGSLDSQDLFHRAFDRQSVSVPACFADDFVPRHGLEPAHDVLAHPGHDVVDPGQAVGRGRPFVEHPVGRAFACGDAAPESVILFPEAADQLLGMGIVVFTRQGRIDGLPFLR